MNVVTGPALPAASAASWPAGRHRRCSTATWSSCCFFTIGIKARYMAIIYGLVAIAMLFGEQRMYAFPSWAARWPAGSTSAWRRAGASRSPSARRWYGLRNRYYRWKRRRAARKFEVYMRSQGRTVKLRRQGRQIDEDHERQEAAGIRLNQLDSLAKRRASRCGAKQLSAHPKTASDPLQSSLQ